MAMKIFQYITLAFAVASLVPEFAAAIAAKRATASKFTGAEISGMVAPALVDLQAINAKFTPPAELVADVSQAAADSINRYVLG